MYFMIKKKMIKAFVKKFCPMINNLIFDAVEETAVRLLTNQSF